MALDLKGTRMFDDGDPLLMFGASRHRHGNPENQKIISRIAKQARDRGMSYGKYVALMGDGLTPEYVPKRKRKKRT